MKRIIALMSGALLLVAGLCASCQKELGSQDEKSTTVGEVVVKATIAGNDTKVSFTVDGTNNKLKTAWEESDNIIGWDADGNKIELAIASIEDNGKTAIFKKVDNSANIPTSGKVYMIYAPDKHFSDITTDKTLVYNLSEQASNNVPALMTATGEVSNNVLTLSFTNQLAIVALKDPKFDVSAATNITGLKLSGSNIQTTATFGMNGNTLQMSSSEGGAITRSCSINTDADGKTSNTMVYFAVLPNSTEADVTISTTAPTGYQISFSNKSFAASQCYLLSQKGIDKQKFTITVADGITGGSITTSPSGSSAWDETVTITATPNIGYELTTNSIAVTGATSGNSIDVTDNKFTMPQEAVTINGSFQKVYYDIAKADATHGSFTVKKGDTEVSTANYEDEITIETNPNDGYIVDAITVKKTGGESVGVANETFIMPASAVTVTVTFKAEIPGTLPDYTIEEWE